MGSIVQTSPRGTSNGPALLVQTSFSATPTPNNSCVVLVSTGSGAFGTDPTGWSVTDTQAIPNTYTLRATAIGQKSRIGIFTAPITTASGTFTVQATVAAATVDGDQGITLLETTPLNFANLVDILIQLDNQATFPTSFIVNPSTLSDDELVIAMTAPRANGSFNTTPSPAVPPTFFATIAKVDSGAGAIYAASRIAAVAGAQAIDLSGVPIDGSPPLIVVSFRFAAAVAPAGPALMGQACL